MFAVFPNCLQETIEREKIERRTIEHWWIGIKVFSIYIEKWRNEIRLNSVDTKQKMNKVDKVKKNANKMKHRDGARQGTNTKYHHDSWSRPIKIDNFVCRLFGIRHYHCVCVLLGIASWFIAIFLFHFFRSFFKKSD